VCSVSSLPPLYHISYSSDSGYTSLPQSTISPELVSVSFLPSPSAGDTTPLRLLTNGEPEPYIDEERAAVILKEEDLEVEIDLGSGSEEARVWTCDFSHVSCLSGGDSGAIGANWIGIRYY
jgi:glutamate N-acetyltransferase/amino-acid N-acetyltransferase